MTLHLDRYLESAVYFDSFEHTTCEVMSRVLRSGGVFIDAGANIGFFTLMAARLVGTSGRVFAFEPNRLARDRLCQDCRRNGYLGIVDVRACGLGAEESTADLFVPTAGDSGLASLRPGSSVAWHERQRVQIRRLDDEYRLERAPHLIKIDVEGAELLVLRGARQLVERHHPHVICEVNCETSRQFGYDPLEIARFMVSDIGGYDLYLLTSRGIRRCRVLDSIAVVTPKIENWWFAPTTMRVSEA